MSSDASLGASGSRERTLVQLYGVEFAYGPRAAAALRCEALAVGPGVTMVVGANGAGKSTLLRLVAGVEPPRRGRVLVCGHDLWRDEVAARRAIAYVPEHPELAPYASVGAVVQLVARLRDCPDADAWAALDRVGLGELAHRTVRELSMGQRRRALLAAALVGDPTVVVLDEPLEAMDLPTRAAIVRWAAERRVAGAAVLIATHEVAPFAPLVDDVLVVAGGVIRRATGMPAEETARVAWLEAAASGAI